MEPDGKSRMDIRELQAFFDQCQDIVALVDRDLRYEAANLEYCRYWDVPRDRLLRIDLPAVVKGAFDEGVHDHLARCLAGEDVVFERWQDFPGAGRRHMHVRYTPRRSESGEVAGVFLIARDITERVNLQTEILAERDKLNSIFRATRVGIGVVKDRVIIQANDFFFEMLGYSSGELLGRDSRVVYASEEAYQRAGQEAYGSIHGDSTASLETQWRRKDGTVLDILVTITFLNPEEPRDGATFVAMDITDRKKAEEVVRESERRFREIFENVSMIAVQGYDRHRRVVYWNPASEQLYGYTRGEAMGRLLEDLIIPAPLREIVVSGHEQWVNGGLAIPAGELELVHKDGSPVPVYSSHVMQETQLGEKFMYCVDVDLAEIKRIHNRLVRAKEEAEEANRAKSEFLANMSHEIRTPLNGIKGMLSLLKSTPLNDLQMEYTQAGIDSATRLNRLLSDILDLSRVEAGKMFMEMEMFNLPQLVRQVGDLFRLAFDEKGLDLECVVAPDIPENVIGDSARLYQVFSNLVGNGLKFTDKGGVRLEAIRLEPIHPGVHRVLFSVTDTGIGIGEEVLQSLFEPFTQGSRGYTRKYQGAGLGLSICRRLVDLMGGNMAVESEPDKGSTFYVMIPFDENPAAANVREEQAGDTASMAVQLRVLLAEDDRVNSMVGQRLLEKAGCSVMAVGSGARAIEALCQEEFAAVFMDVQMPDMDGVAATRSIREGLAGEKNRDIPIFALTAYTMAGDRERFMESGMDGYVPKPVEAEDILRALRTAVLKRHGDRN